jgi:hypothetical protein
VLRPGSAGGTEEFRRAKGIEKCKVRMKKKKRIKGFEKEF